MKKFLTLCSIGAAFVIIGAGCSKPQNPAPSSSSTTGTQTETQQNQGGENQNTQAQNVSDDADVIFSDPHIPVTFHYIGYLQKQVLQSATGTVRAQFNKRPGSNGIIDTFTFSAKTKQEFLTEKKDPTKVCDSEDMPGCEKWDADYALYRKAIAQNNYDGYYALGTNKTVISGIPFVVIVTYNLDTKQYQTRYIGYLGDNLRITFTDPGTGGLEYGVPFQMTAKNRDMVEQLGRNIAKRQKIDDVKTRARADAFFQIVSTVKVNVNK
jgi:hypothetical protein